MKAYVFTDQALAKHAGRFVWLAIDGEKAVNAEFRRRYKIPGFPSYYVLDPETGGVRMRWVGSASVSQLDRLFTEQSESYARSLSRRSAPLAADALLAHADSLYALDAYAGAAAGYGRALSAAPKGWRGYARAVDSRLFSLSQADSAESCVALAEASWPGLRKTSSSANVAATGLGCALELAEDAPRRAERIAFFEQACREVLADPGLELTGDDRSGVYISLLDAREAAKDSVGRQRVAEEWSAFLDGAAAKAPNPEARTVYDSHRLSAYIEIGHPERAIPMLEQSARDLPDDYNPHARLAIAYRNLKRWDEALAESDKALAMAYGPRKVLFFQNRADIYRDRGDAAGHRKTLEDGIAYAKTLPDGQRPNNLIASLEKRLTALP